MLKNYFKSAYRSLLKQKSFSFLNIAGLTFGLTACLLIALFVWDEQQYDKFIPEGEQVYRVYIERTTVSEGTENMAFTPPMFATTLEQEFPEVEEALRFFNIQWKVLFEANGKQIYEGSGIAAESGFFEFFPLHFVFGSPKNALADPTSIVISTSLAERYFGTENPVGKEILIDNDPFQVKGVYQNNPKFHLAVDYIIPLQTMGFPEERMQSWTWQNLFTYVKVKKGVNGENLEAKFQKLVEQDVHPILKEGGMTYLPQFQPLENIHLYSADFKYDMAVRGNITYVKGLSLIALFILVIACFNFVNLATAKSLKRAKEVGVRKSIGASRNQLILQFLSESILLAFISVLISVLLTLLLLPWLNDFTGKQMALPVLNPLVLLLLVSLSIIVGVIAGLYPAMVLSGFQPVKVLKGGSAGNVQPGKIPWLRHGLVVLQFAVSVLLIISAIVVYQQVEFLNNKDLGFEKEQIMFFPMRGENMVGNYEAFKNQLLQSPGVSSVSIGYGFPGDMVAGDGIIVPRGGEHKRYSVTQLMVDHDYIKTLGVEVIAGRDFSKEITTDATEGFIINETAVKELGFGTPEEALGQPLHWEVWVDEPADSLKKGQVIGVVKDFHYKSLYDEVEPTVLQIFPPAFWKVAVKMKTADIAATLEHVKTTWNSFSPEYPLEYGFLDDSFEQMYKAEDKLRALLWIFTGMAIFVGCLGLFGLAAYAAERRKKEIGIRKVLGASVQNIVVLLSQDFVKLVLISLLIASPIAWYLMQGWLQDFAYRIDIGWWVFGLAGFAAVAIALLTVGFHAIKAALKNPVKNLRIE
ncbi:ABC transporter permease [Nafulsella turpanensis]|uniref:ABC transporter permease n=1 Tax=Nafulsella turpanensis TaxID=1265690 RepID=UPI0003469FBE|nr:ABC transporter permease [Nafulsella turpanensis]